MGFLLRLLIPFKAIWGYVALAGGAIAAVLTFGLLKQRQGRREKEAEDREAISEAVSEKRDRDRAIRAAPSGSGRERVREQTRGVRELLRSKRTTATKRKRD